MNISLFLLIDLESFLFNLSFPEQLLLEYYSRFLSKFSSFKSVINGGDNPYRIHVPFCFRLMMHVMSSIHFHHYFGTTFLVL